jgi:thiol-disulfide isomerase/thioredoxin
MVVPAFAAEPPQASPPPAPTKAVRSPGNAQWASTPDEARSLAAAQKKLVFYEFDQAKCGKCRRMDQLLYPAFEFEALLIPMVPVKVMIDSADGKRLAGRYGIEDVPAILVTTPQGRLAFQMQGFVNAQDFYPHIHKDLDAYRVFSKKIDAQDVPRLSAQAALDAGRELYRLSDPAAAQPRLARAISAPHAPAPVRDEAREILAAVEQDLSHFPASRETIERLIATCRDPDRLERAELFRAQLSLAENKPADAYALFQKFQKDHPQSLYRSQVDALIARVEASLPK